jgi:lipopolysaccharide assembly protein B
MVIELLFLLLPIAALSGWWIGRRGRLRGEKESAGCLPLSSDFFKGLNYLLDEQPDQALEVFIRMSEADSETIEIQFALANLFLRRGEVDRAIRIHQNLMARPMLSREQRKKALYELGLDYMRAGLLDRAESLFHELTDDYHYAASSRGQLLDIYQQEKEWEKAIEVARQLNGKRDKAYSPVIAHYYCELAELLLKSGELGKAEKMLSRAFSEDRNCVRASMLEAEVALRQQQPKQAIRAYKRVESQDPEYLPLVVQPMRQCFEQLGQQDEYLQYLRFLSSKEQGISLLLALSKQLNDHGMTHQAITMLYESLRQRPSLRALDYLLELRGTDEAAACGVELTALRDVIHMLLEGKPVYQCGYCGYTTRTLQWQCPSCKQWGTIKPIHGIEGE